MKRPVLVIAVLVLPLVVLALLSQHAPAPQNTPGKQQAQQRARQQGPLTLEQERGRIERRLAQLEK
jgi:hypothetical protein